MDKPKIFNRKNNNKRSKHKYKFVILKGYKMG